MRSGPYLLSREDTEKGWCLLEETTWSRPADDQWSAAVSCKVRNTLSVARRQAIYERFDLHPAWVSSGLDSWASKTSTPANWIPRAALQAPAPFMKTFIWIVVVRAWRLLVRPSSMACSLQVPLFKRGDVDQYQSWRNIIINAQLGLLYERIYFWQFVARIRQHVGRLQSCYIHRCDYHTVALHELIADRRAFSIPFFMLMGDITGAFPKAWRDLFAWQPMYPCQVGK